MTYSDDSVDFVMPRRMVWRLLVAFLFVWPYDGSAEEINRLSPEEEAQGFQLLFDGESLAGWRNARSDGIRPQWQVIDGAMVLTAKGGRDLITEESFAHFDLRLEYTIAERGNSGVMFRVVEKSEERSPWRLAPEYQLYDSFNVKVRGDRCAGALYGLIAAPQDLARKPGEWNQVRILLEPAEKGTDRLRFWLNAHKTVDVVIDWSPTSRWSQLLETAKDKDHFAEGFFKVKNGPILLQDHGARTAFRNIRIRRMDQDSSGGVPYRLAERTQVVPLGTGGGLKMFYDNRMYPQAVALGDSVYIVWRGQEGYPYLATYDLNRRRSNKPTMLLDGFPDSDEIKPGKYRKDHHYAPVIWSDQEEHLHVLFGCHKTPGIHLISKEPRSTQAWLRGPPFSESVSYPKVHRVYDEKTLVYYRESGHLGRWQYRISDDGGRRWVGPPRTVVDLDAKDEYGWGQRVEQWESRDGGNSWILRRNLSPVDHQRYQSIQFVSRDMRAAVRDLILFYGWSDRNGPGTAYLWDARRP